EHEVCYAGWMTRTHPNSNEIFDPKTVAQKIDVRSPCRNVMPVVFDLVERTAIWVDMKTRCNEEFGGNNVASNRATISQKTKAIVCSDNKLSLYELFQLHVAGRGELVQNKEDAQTVFSLYQGTGPFDVNEINAEYLM
ncbi:MAG: cytoplasmic protein, partial [Algicola sp.]|nr:cytoplasmic protein [Algicola sp.]